MSDLNGSPVVQYPELSPERYSKTNDVSNPITSKPSTVSLPPHAVFQQNPLTEEIKGEPGPREGEQMDIQNNLNATDSSSDSFPPNQFVVSDESSHRTSRGSDVNEPTPLIRGQLNPTGLPILRDCGFVHIMTLLAFFLLAVFVIGFAVYYSWLPYTSVDSPDFQLIKREDWLAEVPKANLPILSHPLKNVLLLETNTKFCTTTRECKSAVKEIQYQFLKSTSEKESADIDFNFLVGGDSKIYEGRGWIYESSSIATKDTLVVAFIGHYVAEYSSEDQKNALEAFLNYGVAQKTLATCYNILTNDPKNTYLKDVSNDITKRSLLKENRKCYR